MRLQSDVAALALVRKQLRLRPADGSAYAMPTSLFLPLPDADIEADLASAGVRFVHDQHLLAATGKQDATARRTFLTETAKVKILGAAEVCCLLLTIPEVPTSLQAPGGDEAFRRHLRRVQYMAKHSDALRRDAAASAKVKAGLRLLELSGEEYLPASQLRQVPKDPAAAKLLPELRAGGMKFVHPRYAAEGSPDGGGSSAGVKAGGGLVAGLLRDVLGLRECQGIDCAKGLLAWYSASGTKATRAMNLGHVQFLASHLTPPEQQGLAAFPLATTAARQFWPARDVLWPLPKGLLDLEADLQRSGMHFLHKQVLWEGGRVGGWGGDALPAQTGGGAGGSGGRAPG